MALMNCAEYGFVILSEDALSDRLKKEKRTVLNQWTYQARMYNAARYVCSQPDMELVQLVSFGCGTDAITGDEMRAILEEHGKLYTQLKIERLGRPKKRLHRRRKRNPGNFEFRDNGKGPHRVWLNWFTIKTDGSCLPRR